MATVILSLHAKQPKRGTISFDKAYIELFRVSAGRGSYHHLYGRRSQRSGIRRFLPTGRWNTKWPIWKWLSPERKNRMHLDYTIDVMDMMTSIRKDWGMTYPEEEH
jgi:hypothetical protein